VSAHEPLRRNANRPALVEKPGGQSYRTAIVFIIAAAILLPAPFVVLLSAFHYVPSWFRHKKKNFVRVFNVASWYIEDLTVDPPP